MPVRMFVTAGSTADCTQACHLVEGIDVGSLIADKGYDSDAIVEHVQAKGIDAVIPPGKSSENTTNIFIAFVILSRMLSCN